MTEESRDKQSAVRAEERGLEAPKVKLLVRKLGARSESEAIRTVIDDFLFADEVMKRVRNLRRRGTLLDTYQRARSG